MIDPADRGGLMAQVRQDGNRTPKPTFRGSVVAIALVVGLAVGGLAVYAATPRSLPRQHIVTGTVTAVNGDRTAFGFATDGGQKTGFGLFETQGAAAIRVGTRLRLVVVDGDAYQVVVSASPLR
jgi:hypothetical protein